jgi:hypothetical protein
MKPYVICHMNSSVDGRVLGSRWRPSENRMAGVFERIHEELGGGSGLIGRITGGEYAKVQACPSHTDQTYPGRRQYRTAPRRSCPGRRLPRRGVPAKYIGVERAESYAR